MQIQDDMLVSQVREEAKKKFTHIECPRFVRSKEDYVLCVWCRRHGTGARSPPVRFEENCIFSVLKETRRGEEKYTQEGRGALLKTWAEIEDDGVQ